MMQYFTMLRSILVNTCRCLLIRDTSLVNRRERRKIQQPNGVAKIYRKMNAKRQIPKVCHPTLLYERPGYLSNNNWVAVKPVLVMTLGLSSWLKNANICGICSSLASVSSHGATSFKPIYRFRIWIYNTNYPNSSFITFIL
jgi:hypothetical protein